MVAIVRIDAHERVINAIITITGGGRGSRMVLQAAVGQASAAIGSVAGSTFVPLQGTGDFLWLAIVFFVLALGAALVGFRGLAGISMEIARIFILIFIVLAVIALIL